MDVVYALAAAPNFPESQICLAACHSGLRLSDDGGLHWQPVVIPGFEIPPPATSVAASSGLHSDDNIFVGIPGGVLRSTDQGKTWTPAALALPPPFISAIVVSPDYKHDGIVFAGTIEDGVFRSSDYGVTWEPWNFGLLDLNVLCIAASPGFAQDGTVFIGTETGIFYSTNRGRSWRETDFPGDFAPVLSMVLSPSFAQDEMIFVGTESSGLFYSDNRGLSWQRAAQLETTDSVNAILLTPAFPKVPDILVITDADLGVSHDAGHSWSAWQTGLDFSVGITTAIAPMGFGSGFPLLVGLADGRIIRLLQ